MFKFIPVSMFHSSVSHNVQSNTNCILINQTTGSHTQRSIHLYGFRQWYLSDIKRFCLSSICWKGRCTWLIVKKKITIDHMTLWACVGIIFHSRHVRHFQFKCRNPPLDDYQAQYAHDWNEDLDLDLERRPVCVMYQPGEKSIYSGGGYTILELLVEEISGLTFTDYMQREIFDPLGMTQSSFAYTQNTHPDFATPYNEQGEALPKYRLAAKAAGGLNSNIEDLARFACAEISGPEGEPPGRGVISPEAIELLMTPVIFSETIEGIDFHAALGHFVFDVAGASCVHHTGGNIGWRTIYAVLPAH